ncbi:MAG: hypothetical protein H7Y33_01775 [Cytophagales bacterium]|nr:hypothetical protein [Rhizobacter sp.]
MKDDVQTIRKRLQDLHDLHTTGFVDDVQYAESLQVLERRLINAVMKEEPAAELPPQAPVEAVRSEPVLGNPVASNRWVPWLVAAVLVHLLAGGIYWWASSGSPERAEVADKPLGTPAAQMPASGLAAASVQATASAAVIETAPATAPAVMTPGATSISGTVTLAPSLAHRARATDTLFVYARAIDGPAMPLAVIRKQVKDLPMAFKLDDSMATWPNAKVSAFPRIVVTARVSKSGEGQARNGDLLGESPAVAAGVAGLQIEIGSVVEK